MSHAEADLVADAILYEGYLLYPYRASSVKNRSRWTFGGLFPQAWCSAHGTEASVAQAECLLRADGGSLRIRARFLHLVERAGWQEAIPREVVLEAALADL